YRQVKKLSIRETAEATSYSTSQVCRVQALFRPCSGLKIKHIF
ncbi:resolvase, partial [Klebsiella pneumoniae]|nr:resolvase [Klebsiella pneumoniae]